MRIYYPIASSIGPSTSSLKRHGRALKSTSRLVSASPNIYIYIYIYNFINTHTHTAEQGYYTE